MRRSFFIALVALAVMPLTAGGLESLWIAVANPSTQHWFDAVIDVVKAGLGLTLAVLVLRISERPPKQPLWLPDWRFLHFWRFEQSRSNVES